MKKFILIMLIGAMLLSAAACGTQSGSAQPAENSSASQPVSSDGTKPLDVAQEEISAGAAASAGAESAVSGQEQAAAPVTREQAEKAAGGAVRIYRGTVDDFAVDDTGKTVWILRQDYGADYGSPVLNVSVDDTTLMGIQGPESTVANGSHLEVYYADGQLTPGSVGAASCTAVAVNILFPAEMTTYNGIVAEVTPDAEQEGMGDILLKPQASSDGGMDFLFHYTPDTIFDGVDIASLKAGDTVHVLFNGVATRSIPPQGTALEIRPFLEGGGPEEQIAIG